jgi:TolB-like protein
MSLFAELKRRNVFRVAAGYVVLSWLLIQIADTLSDTLALPDWTGKMVLMLLVIGVIPTLIFSWVYELTPEGVKKESEINAEDSVTAHTARKLDLAVIGLLILAMGMFALDRFAGTGEPPGSDSISLGNPALTSSPSAETITQPSIAVLPFENMSTDPENGYFADGISEEILNLLADVRELSVASRTSAFAFKGKDTPIPESAASLAVGFVLEGSVRKSGNQVRITAQLIDARSDRHLWSKTYDRTLEDIFAIQDEIAGAIGDALQVELLGAGGKQIQSEAIDPDSFAKFLEARHLMRGRTAENLALAIELLSQVVESEPGFARGHVVLGEAYLLADNNSPGSLLDKSEVTKAQARLHAELAREINPDLAGIYLILGNLSDKDLVAAINLFTRAIELEPLEPRPYHWRALLFINTGHLQQALADARTANRMEADNAGALGTLGGTLSALGRIEQSMAVFRRMLDVNGGGSEALGFLHMQLGEIEAAENSFPETDWFELVIAVARDRSALPDLIAAIEARQYPNVWELRSSLLALELHEQYLEYALDAPMTFASAIWQPHSKPARRDPRFIEFMEREGIVEFWREFGPPPDCRPEGDRFTCGHGYPEGYASENSTP